MKGNSYSRRSKKGPLFHSLSDFISVPASPDISLGTVLKKNRHISTVDKVYYVNHDKMTNVTFN